MVDNTEIHCSCMQIYPAVEFVRLRIKSHGLLLSPFGGWGLIVLFIIPIGVIKEEALNSIKSLKQTGRADATIEHFRLTGVFQGSMVF